eukprot:7762405-Pyramimonas_sp.AAC.1
MQAVERVDGIVTSKQVRHPSSLQTIRRHELDAHGFLPPSPAYPSIYPRRCCPLRALPPQERGVVCAAKRAHHHDQPLTVTLHFA